MKMFWEKWGTVITSVVLAASVVIALGQSKCSVSFTAGGDEKHLEIKKEKTEETK